VGFFSKLFSVGSSEPIRAVGNIFDELFTSDDEREQAKLMMKKIEQHPALVQAEINKVQAQHRSTFVAGARPFLMWVCGLGFLFAFVINPVLAWIMPEIGAPELPMGVMMELTLAMLGLASLRTLEKLKGVAK
jgi:hypothetical protein